MDQINLVTREEPESRKSKVESRKSKVESRKSKRLPPRNMTEWSSRWNTIKLGRRKIT